MAIGFDPAGVAGSTQPNPRTVHSMPLADEKLYFALDKQYESSYKGPAAITAPHRLLQHAMSSFLMGVKRIPDVATQTMSGYTQPFQDLLTTPGYLTPAGAEGIGGVVNSQPSVKIPTTNTPIPVSMPWQSGQL